MALQQRSEPKSDYIRPLECECGGRAILVRTILESKTHIFQCYKCRELIEESSEP